MPAVMEVPTLRDGAVLGGERSRASPGRAGRRGSRGSPRGCRQSGDLGQAAGAAARGMRAAKPCSVDGGGFCSPGCSRTGSNFVEGELHFSVLI